MFKTTADLLNIKNISTDIPEEFNKYFDIKKYTKAQKYLISNTKFSLISSTFFLIIQIVFIVFGGFNSINKIATSFRFNYILTGLIFVSILFLISEILKIPFSIYHTFVIEENFEFNKTTAKIFITDLLKSWIINIMILCIIFSVILYLFTSNHKNILLYIFMIIVIFELFIIFIAPVTIMPLFNKYTPLENGELKNSIEEYIKKENFKMKGLFKMDGSKRSTKSNAFFTGFGKFRRIVLFDTLINKHTTDELINILAHEMGHFKLGHIVKHIIFSFISIGAMLFTSSFFIYQKWLYAAFFMQSRPIYAGIIFCVFLYTPISFITSIILNYISRKYEYQADNYAVTTYEKPEAMVSALKKLSVDNLSNLHPNKLKVFLEYSHPPILERIKAIKNIAKINEKLKTK
jgi:STE24 endopeptidase